MKAKKVLNNHRSQRNGKTWKSMNIKVEKINNKLTIIIRR